MYSNIMIPVSFDEERDVSKAIDVAKHLASDGARITFVHVLETIPVYVSELIPPETFIERRKRAEELLENAKAGVENGHAVILDGSAGRALCDWARDNDADCLVIPSHKPEMSDIFLGSTASWVVRHCGCSVHVVR